MARFLNVNGQAFPPGTQRFAVNQNTPITLAITLFLSDADVASGDEYELNLSGGGIVFNHLNERIPAGTGPIAHLVFLSGDGFTQPGNWQIKIVKIAGAGANPIAAIWTLDFQVQQIAATQNAPTPRNEERAPAMQTRVALESQDTTPQPTPARDGGWIKKISLFTILLSGIAAVVMLFLFIIFLLLLELAGISMIEGFSSSRTPVQEMTEFDL